MLIATRAVTLLIVGVTLNISLHGQQQLAKLGLAAVTTGTLLLIPDAFSAFLREKALRWPSEGAGGTRARTTIERALPAACEP